MIRRPPRSTRTDTLFPYTTRFRSVWSEVKPVQAQLNSRETNTAFASLVRDEEPVAIARFTITPPLQSVPATIDILYPVSSLRAVEVELTANLHDDGGIASRHWRERMGSALSDVRLEARSVLARPNISVAELLTSEERRVGKEWVSTGRTRWSQ